MAKKREGGRSGNNRRQKGLLIKQMPWRLPTNIDKPIEPLDEEGITAIHKGAMTILEEIGIEFLNYDALKILKKSGCKVNNQNVKMDRNFVMEKIKRAPSKWSITPRNPERKIIVGGNHLLFGNVYALPN